MLVTKTIEDEEFIIFSNIFGRTDIEVAVASLPNGDHVCVAAYDVKKNLAADSVEEFLYKLRYDFMLQKVHLGVSISKACAVAKTPALAIANAHKKLCDHYFVVRSNTFNFMED